MKNENNGSPGLQKLRKELNEINERLKRVEVSLQSLKSEKYLIDNSESVTTEEDFDLKLPSFHSGGVIESHIGEYGMAWMGNFVLFFGIVFLAGYLSGSVAPIFSTLIGFASVAALYVFSFFTRNSFSYLSKLFTYNGHLLLYFFTLRLHFFQDNPIIKSETLGLILLIVVTLILLYRSLQQESQVLAGIVLLLLVACGVFSNSTNVMAGIACATSALAVFFYYRYGWLKLAFIFVFLIYLAHSNWLLNNPLLGNNLEFINSPGAGYRFFIATGFIFSILALIPKKEKISNEFIISSVIWNGLGFSLILAAIIITYFQENYVPIFISITLFCLIYAVILELKSEIKVTASMYVLYGFMALSVVIYGIFGLPKSYMLFAIQSLLVVSMALWFRSRFMVITNTLIFLSFMVIALSDSFSRDATNFTFLLVAFISARVINWEKDRLNIKTEFVRNIYLLAGFIMTLITFYHASPESYITASWILAGVLFFLLSLIIKNIKYRWLAISAMVASAVRLIFVEMSSINIGYRVLVFLILAIVSIIVSVFYTRHLKKKIE